MREKLEEIGACVAITIGTIVIVTTFLGGITYMATHEKTIIMHSDTGDYVCTVLPLFHNPTGCKPIEGMK